MIKKIIVSIISLVISIPTVFSNQVEKIDLEHQFLAPKSTQLTRDFTRNYPAIMAFGNGRADALDYVPEHLRKTILGGKGKGLADMASFLKAENKEVLIRSLFEEPTTRAKLASIGLDTPEKAIAVFQADIPPGFTLTTEIANEYFLNGNAFPEDVDQLIDEYLEWLEQSTGKTIGASENPLLLSVRSGAAISMPGMMDTVLNIGMNDVVVEAMANESGRPQFAWDSYRRLLQMYGDVIMGIHIHEFEKVITEKKIDILKRYFTQILMPEDGVATPNGLLKGLFRLKDDALQNELSILLTGKNWDQVQSEFGKISDTDFETKADLAEKMEELYSQLIEGGTQWPEIVFRINQLLESDDTSEKLAYLLNDNELEVDDLKDLVTSYKKVYKDKGFEFPQDPRVQVRAGIRAVFDSSFSQKALDYRRLNKIPDHIVSAVNVQSMAFGNLNDQSATGVAFTRNPSNGEPIFFGEYLVNAQGEDVVAGIRDAVPINDSKGTVPQGEVTLQKRFPKNYQSLFLLRLMGEKYFKDMQDLEFTIENEKLYMLQTRNGKRTAHAAVNIAIDLVKEGIATEEDVMRGFPDPAKVLDLFLPLFEEDAVKKATTVAKGVDASPGDAVGVVVFTADEAVQLDKQFEKEWSDAGKPDGERKRVILVRKETAPEDINGMAASAGILTQLGGATSHAAVVARGMGVPAVVGASISINEEEGYFTGANGVRINRGDTISLSGGAGKIYAGILPLADPIIERDPLLQSNFDLLMEMADRVRQTGVRANAETENDLTNAVKNGTQGVGLARTEHMFFEPEKLIHMRAMILADTDQERNAALTELLRLQTDDFEMQFSVLEDRPNTIRLLDPPLHEFLPKLEDEEDIAGLAQLLNVSTDKIKERIQELHETNPMFGFRGVRLSLAYPGLAEMQARAIFSAAKRRKDQGFEVHPEIMIPLISTVGEFNFVAEIVQKVAEEFGFERGLGKDYLLGTMIEIPSAGFDIEPIAKVVDFISFGTNDYTQTHFKFSRDDAGKIVIPAYVELGILKIDPFQTIDPVVLKVLSEVISRARKVNPKIKCGICGEQGGDPDSIPLLVDAGLDYLSASPMRLLVMRLALAKKAAQGIKTGATIPAFEDTSFQTTAKDQILKMEESILSDPDKKEALQLAVIRAGGEIDNQLKQILIKFWSQNLSTISSEQNIPVRLLDMDFTSLFIGINDESVQSLAKKLRMEVEDVLKTIDSVRELNPALGNRGVRPFLSSHPGLFETQVSALFEAAKDANKPIDILLPLVIDAKEVEILKNRIKNIAEKFPDVHYRAAAIIETPRAAIMSDKIAEVADAIYIDTLGLTESTLGFASEDAKRFIPIWIQLGIYDQSPLEKLTHSVAYLIARTISEARKTMPILNITVYGHDDLKMIQAEVTKVVDQSQITPEIQEKVEEKSENINLAA